MRSKSRDNTFILSSAPSQIDLNEQHLSYFINELSPRLKVGSSSEGVDIKSLYAEDAFRMVIIASSSTHQSMALSALDSRSNRVESIQAQQNAILALRTATSSELSSVALRQTFQASVLLCVINGMLDPCNGGISFRSHLEAAKALLDRMEAPMRPLKQETQPWTFFFSIFSTMELVNAIMTGKRPLFNKDSWTAFGSCYCWWGTIASNDPFLEVLSLISNVAALAADSHLARTDTDIGTILSIHSALQHQIKAESATAIDEWITFCAIYRNAATLYMYRAVAHLTLNHHLVRKIVDDSIILLESLPPQSRSCSLLPLLLLGLNCVNPFVMDKIRQYLAEINNHLFFGAIGAVLECLEKHWQVIEELSANSCLESHAWWEHLPDIADSVCLF